MFLNAIMLAGLGGAAVPLVLHLLNRARYRDVEWGAMMFLTSADVRQQRSTRAKQILLLALRMAIVSLLALAMARPLVRGTWGALGSAGRTTAVIVLDASVSMGFQENGRTRLDLAREAALEVLANLRKGDQAALVVLGDLDRGSTGMSSQPTTDLQAVASRLNDLKPMYGEADMAGGLDRAAEVLERHEPLNRELYVICSRRAEVWRHVQEDFAKAWQRRVGAWEVPPVRFAVVPVGTGETDNLAVESVELVDPPAVKQRPAEVEVRVRNYGPVPHNAVPLVLRVGDRELSRMQVQIAAGASGVWRFPVTFNESESQVLSATIEGPAGTSWDDRMETAIDVVSPVKTLIISGDERSGAFRSESDFARLALAPFRTAGRAAEGVDPAVVTVLAAEKWTHVELSDYRVVVLANVTQLTTAQARSLEQFVYDGGGLLVAPGGLARADNYNSSLYRAGAGILPAALEPATPADGSAATNILGLDLDHPMFRFLKKRSDPVPLATVGRYFPAAPRPADARVLGSYASGRPFLIEATVGRGRVLLMTTSIDADWNTLPLTAFYLPFMQSAVRYLVAGALVDRNLHPGQVIAATVRDAAVGGNGKASVLLPDGGKADVLAAAAGSGTAMELRYGRTAQPGRYVLQVPTSHGPVTLHYIVRPSSEQSDLTPLTQQQWTDLAGMMSFTLVDPQKQSVAALAAGVRSGHELWGTLLGAVLALGMIELALTRWWTHQEHT